MKRFSYLVMWFAGLLVASCAPVSSGQLPVGSTVDPFVALANEQATNQASEQKIELLSGQLTATAEAPIVAITQTAAAFEMQMIIAQATAQSVSATETVAVTQTAMSWTATPNATSTIVAAQAMAESTQIANDTQIDNLMVDRARTTNTLRAMAVYVVGFIVLLGAMMFMITWAKRLSFVPTPIHESGKPHHMLNVIDAVVSDGDRMTNGMARLTTRYVRSSLPAITPERQDAVTNRAQLVDMQTRRGKLPRSLMQNTKALPAGETTEPTSAQIDDEDLNLPLPAWDFIYKWDGSAKPLGFGRQGLILSKATSPHILVAGTSGAGKTRFILRPLTAASLAKGEVVFNIGYSQAGFGVFETHPNYYSMQLRDPRDVVQALAQVYEEIQRRKEMIGGADMDWEHWQGGKPPLPFLTLLVDEMENMSEEISADYDDGAKVCKEMWSLVARITKEGRKTGVVFNSALQDGTGKSIDLRFRRNCTLVALRLGDASHSSAFIGSSGAQNLTLGRFMARTDELVIGGGFEPSDSDILSYLSRYAVPTLEKPKWIEGVVKPNEQGQIAGSNEARSLPEADGVRLTGEQSVVSNQLSVGSDQKPKFSPEIIGWAEQLRQHPWQEMSGNKICELLWNESNSGVFTKRLREVRAYLGSTTSSTTENKAEIGEFEAVGA